MSAIDPAACAEPPAGSPAVAGMADSGLLEVR